MKHLLLTFFILFTCAIHSQEKKVKGTIYDQFNNELDIALVKNLRTSNQILTKCNGQFKLNTKIGDTLEIQRPYYKKRLYVAQKNNNLKINLFLDGKEVSRKINKEGDIRYGASTTEQRKNSRIGSSEPLIIIDKKFIIVTSYDLGELNPDNIQDVNIFKRKEAVDIFGDYANKGLIFVTKKCYE